MSVYIKPCEIIFNKDTIKCGGIKIAQRAANAFDISKLELSLNEQKLSAKGEFAEKENFLINVDIKNLQIDTLFTFLPSPYVRFGGEATGNIAVAKDSTIHISSKDLIIKDFSYLNGLLGDTNAKVSYDIDHSELLLDVDIACEDNHSTKIEGYVDCSRHDSLNLHIDANKLRIDFLNTWVGKFLEDFHGDLTGLVHLYGPGNELKLIGEPSIDASFTNHLSGSRFFLKDYVSLYKDEDSDNSHIDLHNAKFLDTFGNEAT